MNDTVINSDNFPRMSVNVRISANVCETVNGSFHISVSHKFPTAFPARRMFV